MFVAYLIFEFRVSVSGEHEVVNQALEEASKRAIEDGHKSIVSLLRDHLVEVRENSTIVRKVDLPLYLESVLKKFFKRYDSNRDGRINIDELTMMMQDVIPPEKWNSEGREDKMFELLGYLDTDADDKITWEEFVSRAPDFIVRRFDDDATPSAIKAMDSPLLEEHLALARSQSSVGKNRTVNMTDYNTASLGDDHAEEFSYEDDLDEEFKGLSESQRLYLIKKKAVGMLFVGTVLVVTFSDPMVMVIDEVGMRTGIPLFYVAFLVAPLASNASELVAAYDQARKKTKDGMTRALQCLTGAACMNNTLCLGVFLGIIYFRRLTWAFSAETFAMLFGQLLVGLVGLNRTMRLWHGLLVLLVYPGTLALYWVLENELGLN